MNLGIFNLSWFVLAALALSSCMVQKATDRLTLPRRATDGEHWKKQTKLRPIPFEVKADDGTKIAAYEIHPTPGLKKKGTAYLLHGFGNSKEQMLSIAKRLCAEGFRCIAWDSRGHGASGGDRVTYGTFERDDALRVIHTARKRDVSPHGKEVIWAYSMGTSTALRILPELPEIRSAVLVAPIADLNSVMDYQARNHYRGVLRPFLPLVRANVRGSAGFDPKTVRPADSVKSTRCKLLLIHGDRDDTIPAEQSSLILKSSAPGQAHLLLLKGVGHGGVMWDLPEETRGEAVNFLISGAF